MYCKKCGKYLKEENKFCPSCGEPVSKPDLSNNNILSPSPADESAEIVRENNDHTKKYGVYFCWKCGKPIDPDDSFCIECGTEIRVERKEESEIINAVPEKQEQQSSQEKPLTKTEEFVQKRKSQEAKTQPDKSVKKEEPVQKRNSKKEKTEPEKNLENEETVPKTKTKKEKTEPDKSVKKEEPVQKKEKKKSEPRVNKEKSGKKEKIKKESQSEPEKPGGKKAVKWVAVIAVVVAAIIGIEGAVSGRWGGGKTGGVAVTESLSDTAASEEIRYPGLSDFDLSYTEEEIANAPKTEITISEENTAASAGGFSVDFGEFNTMGDDVLTIRELPVHDFESGYTVQGYDLSLESGKDSFIGEVCVKIPRTEEDGDLIKFATTDPKTGENEYDYFEISDDGQYYLLYTTHFSSHNKVSFNGFGEALKNAIKENDISDPVVRESLNAFFYLDQDYSYNDLMNSSVYYNSTDMWERLSNATVNLDGFKLMEEAANNTGFSGLLFSDKKTLKNAVDTYDAINSYNTFVSGVINPEGIEKAAAELSYSDRIKQLIKNPGKDIASGKGTGVFDIVGGIVVVYNYLCAEEKIIKDLESGAYTDYSSAVWNNWSDVASVGIGIIGLAGAALASAPISVAAAAGGLGLYAYSKITETSYDDLDESELTYRSYFYYHSTNIIGESTVMYHSFYYDEPSEVKETSDGKGRGNIRKIDCLSEEQSNAFKKLLDDNHIQGILLGEDPRSEVKPNEQWLKVLICLHEAVGDDAELFNKAVKQFYMNYCRACSPYVRSQDGKNISNLSTVDYQTFAEESKRVRGSGADTALVPSEEDLNSYIISYYNEMINYHQPIFLAYSKYLTHEARKEVDKMIEDELVPLLNTRMVFSVEDTTLSDPSDFSKSVYSAEPKLIEGWESNKITYKGYTDIRCMYQPCMEFIIRDESGDRPVTEPLFKPSIGRYEGRSQTAVRLSDTEDSWYFPVTDNFWPNATYYKGNVVFSCTLYHYLMMGAPNVISFYDPYAENSDILFVPFEIPTQPDSKGLLQIKIRIEKNDIKELEGLWMPASPASGYEGKSKDGMTATFSVADGGNTCSLKTYDAGGTEPIVSYEQGGKGQYRFVFTKNSDKNTGTLSIIELASEDETAAKKQQKYTVKIINDNIIYIEEMGVYLERSGLIPGNYDIDAIQYRAYFTLDDLSVTKEHPLTLTVSIKDDLSAEISVPALNYQEGIRIYSTKALQITADLSDEPTRQDLEYNATAYVYYVTGCTPAPFAEKLFRDTNLDDSITRELSRVYTAKGGDEKASIILLEFDNDEKNRGKLKKVFIQLYGPEGSFWIEA